jgi:hypothetical protein
LRENIHLEGFQRKLCEGTVPLRRPSGTCEMKSEAVDLKNRTTTTFCLNSDVANHEAKRQYLYHNKFWKNLAHFRHFWGNANLPFAILCFRCLRDSS